jgi:hypothetical protein
MTNENSSPEGDTLTQLARLIYDQMNVEPRRMNVAIELARQHLTDVNRTLTEQGLRSEDVESEHTREP